MQNMIRFINVVGKEKRRAPLFMMVQLGVGQYAHRRGWGLCGAHRELKELESGREIDTCFKHGDHRFTYLFSLIC